MLRAALDAFDRVEPVAAAAVIRQDKELDAEYAAALRRLLTRAMEDPRHFDVALEAAFVMRSLERIGDHARNLARHVRIHRRQRRSAGDRGAAGIALGQELVSTGGNAVLIAATERICFRLTGSTAKSNVPIEATAPRETCIRFDFWVRIAALALVSCECWRRW